MGKCMSCGHTFSQTEPCYNPPGGPFCVQCYENKKNKEEQVLTGKLIYDFSREFKRERLSLEDLRIIEWTKQLMNKQRLL